MSMFAGNSSRNATTLSPARHFRPVVTMDTGFSRFYPVGEGLFDYSDAGGALAAIASINADYPRHCRAARDIAAEYFDAGRVLPAMLAGVGL